MSPLHGPVFEVAKPQLTRLTAHRFQWRDWLHTDSNDAVDYTPIPMTQLTAHRFQWPGWLHTDSNDAVDYTPIPMTRLTAHRFQWRGWLHTDFNDAIDCTPILIIANIWRPTLRDSFANYVPVTTNTCCEQSTLCLVWASLTCRKQIVSG